MTGVGGGWALRSWGDWMYLLGGAAPFQRTVKHIVDKTHLHVLCTPVPEEFLAQNVVFFLRNTKGTFPERVHDRGVCVLERMCPAKHSARLHGWGCTEAGA